MFKQINKPFLFLLIFLVGFGLSACQATTKKGGTAKQPDYRIEGASLTTSKLRKESRLANWGTLHETGWTGICSFAGGGDIPCELILSTSGDRFWGSASAKFVLAGTNQTYIRHVVLVDSEIRLFQLSGKGESTGRLKEKLRIQEGVDGKISITGTFPTIDGVPGEVRLFRDDSIL